MRNLPLVLLPLIFFLTLNQLIAQSEVYSRVKIYINKADDVLKLSELGIPVDGVKIKKNESIVGEFSLNDIQKIRNEGYRVDVLIPDVSKYYEERNKQSADTLKKKLVNAACLGEKYPVPANFTLGSVGGYYSYTEIVKELDSLQTRFPNLISSKQPLSPQTIEGRTTWYVKISDNPSVNENEPKILYVALNHAREPMGMQQLFFFIYYLLENYETDTSIQYLVNNLEMYFVPCANPDGYVYNNTNNPNGGGMHRKNRRPVGMWNQGVDLNRNYGYMWGYDNVGSSNNPDAETYRGSSAFSEPETQAIKNFTEDKQFDLVIDYHCYSNVLLYPWGYNGQPTPDNQIFREWSSLMTQSNGFFYGTPMEGIGYNANGGSFDWYYGEQTTKPKIFAWSPEAGNANDGFYPASNRITHIAQSFMDMNLYFARFALQYFYVEDNSSRFVVNGSKLKYSIKNYGKQSPANALVSFVPISAELQNISYQKTYSNVNFLQSFTDSFSISINEQQCWGKVLKYCYRIETSLGVYFTDTFSVVGGTPVVLLSDNCSSMANWISTTWNTTSSEYHSPTSCITDSPNGYYTENSTRIITLNNSFSTLNAVYAELSFWAKWDIEPLADYVQLQISTNNGNTWYPLCGIHTQRSFLSSTLNQPIYEGQRDSWVHERIELTDYLNQPNLKLRFVLQAGNSQTMQNDGFYIDDIKLELIQPFQLLKENPEPMYEIRIYPNPTESEKVNVFYYIPQYEHDARLVIINSLGMIVDETILTSDEHVISITLPLPGVYWCRIIGSGRSISKPYLFIVK